MALAIVLADSDRERGNILTVFFESLGFVVIRCFTARGALKHLAAQKPHVFMLLASTKLEDGELLPELEHFFCELMHPLPRLLLWDRYGEVDLQEHAPFIDHAQALIFPEPLNDEDYGCVVRAVRLFRDRPEELRPPSPALACPAVERNARLGRRCCVHAVECARKGS